MKNLYWKYLAWIILIVLCIALGYGVGYTKGSVDGMRLAVKVGFLILEDMDIDIPFDEEKIRHYIYAYQHQIDVCYENRNEII